MTSLDLILEECETDEERQSAIYLEAAEINADRAILAYDTFSKMDALNERAANCKVATMGDNFDGMVAFYEDANNKAAASSEKKKGLLRRAWDAVVKAFKALIDKITGLFRKKTIPAEVKKEKISIKKVFVGLGTKLKNAFAKLAAAIKSHKKAVIITSLAAVLAIVGTVAVAKHKGSKEPAKSNSAAEQKALTKELIAKDRAKAAAPDETLMSIEAAEKEATSLLEAGKTGEKCAEIAGQEVSKILEIEQKSVIELGTAKSGPVINLGTTEGLSSDQKSHLESLSNADMGTVLNACATGLNKSVSTIEAAASDIQKKVSSEAENLRKAAKASFAEKVASERAKDSNPQKWASNGMGMEKGTSPTEQTKAAHAKARQIAGVDNVIVGDDTTPINKAPVHKVPKNSNWTYDDITESVDEDNDLDLESDTFNEEWEAEIDAILADI
jgi:hypothetical protein